MAWGYTPKPVEWAQKSLEGALHIAGVPARLVTALAAQLSGLKEGMTSKDVIDYAILGDREIGGLKAGTGHLSSYGELLGEQVTREGGSKLVAQALGLGGDLISDPLMLAGAVHGATAGADALADIGTTTTNFTPRPFPRRLTPLERSDTALGGDLVGRVSQTTPGSQGRAILESAINRTPAGEAVSVGRSSGSFPTFTNRGGKRAEQMGGRYNRAREQPVDPKKWDYRTGLQKYGPVEEYRPMKWWE
jgi:hypothetical protein